MKKLLLAILFTLVLSGGASATITNKDLLNYKNLKTNSEKEKEFHRNVIYSYLLGAGDSYLATNAVLEIKGEKKLFCQPGELTLNVENLITFAEEQIEIQKKDGTFIEEAPLSATLLMRLKKIFPCK